MSGLTIEQMKLDEPAQSFALALRESCPGTIFLSGRRERADQARAMAQDTAKDRSFVRRTYANSPAKSVLVTWLDNNALVTTVGGLYLGFLSLLERMSDEQLSRLTHHFLGLALDILPGSCDDTALEMIVNQYGGKLLDKEGGLVRRHVEFQAAFVNRGPQQEDNAC